MQSISVRQGLPQKVHRNQFDRCINTEKLELLLEHQACALMAKRNDVLFAPQRLGYPRTDPNHVDEYRQL
jgi:hypothetical protein